LFAVSIAGELRAQFEEVHKRARPTTLPPIGAIDQPAQLAHMRKHFGDRPFVRHANCLVRPETMEAPKELLRT